MGHIFFILDLDDRNAYLVISHVLFAWVRQLFESPELDVTASAKKKEKHKEGTFIYEYICDSLLPDGSRFKGKWYYKCAVCAGIGCRGHTGY